MDSRKILQKMTLKEKIALCSGQDFWHTKAMKQYGIEALMMCDGPHGLRKQEGKSDMLGVHNSREKSDVHHDDLWRNPRRSASGSTGPCKWTCAVWNWKNVRHCESKFFRNKGMIINS